MKLHFQFRSTFLRRVLHIANMDSKTQHAAVSSSASIRRASIVVDTTLASEEDAAVLAKMGYNLN